MSMPNMQDVVNPNILVNTDLAPNIVFKHDEIEEAKLVHALSDLGVKTGIDINQFHHIFPLILRMMKSKSDWTR